MDIWPSSPIAVSPQFKQLIQRFFEISDSADPASGKLFAEELFTKDGVFTTHKTLVFKGHDGASCFYTPQIEKRINYNIRLPTH